MNANSTSAGTQVDRLRIEVERLDAIHSATEAQRDAASSEWQRRQSLIDTLDTSTNEFDSSRGCGRGCSYLVYRDDNSSHQRG